MQSDVLTTLILWAIILVIAYLLDNDINGR